MICATSVLQNCLLSIRIGKLNSGHWVLPRAKRRNHSKPATTCTMYCIIHFCAIYKACGCEDMKKKKLTDFVPLCVWERKRVRKSVISLCKCICGLLHLSAAVALHTCHTHPSTAAVCWQNGDETSWQSHSYLSAYLNLYGCLFNSSSSVS